MRRMILVILTLPLLFCIRSDLAATRAGTLDPFMKGRAFSLRVAQRRLESWPSETPLPAEVTALGGITRLTGYVVDDKTHDIILIGQADPAAPKLFLDDFVVALRNAWRLYSRVEGNTRYYSFPGCSIDPDPSVLGRFQRLGEMMAARASARDMNAWLHEWQRLCSEPQQVRVLGVPFNSRFGKVMVTADYNMKRLVDGSDTLSVPGFQSLIDMLLETIRADLINHRPISVPTTLLNRFWFSPGANRYMADKQAAVILECPVTLLTEEEYVTRQGGVRGAGRGNSLALKFCERFSRSYESVARQRPIYRELEGLFRHVAVAKLLEDRASATAAGLDLRFLLNDHAVASPGVNPAVPGRSNVRELTYRQDTSSGYEEARLWLPSCGGVGIDINPKSATYDPSPAGGLSELAAIVKGCRLNSGILAWNYSRMEKTNIESSGGDSVMQACVGATGSEVSIEAFSQRWAESQTMSRCSRIGPSIIGRTGQGDRHGRRAPATQPAECGRDWGLDSRHVIGALAARGPVV